MGLTPKQEAFCLAYIETGNASEAAILSKIDINRNPKNKGYYVYVLFGSLDKKIFYVGKGKKNRMYQHIKVYNRGNENNKYKCSAIEKIIKSGGEVCTAIIEFFDNEWEALQSESETIGMLSEYGITNASKGNRTPSLFSTIRHAELMLRRIVPFDIWKNSKFPENIEKTITMLGGKEAFYNQHKESLLALIKKGKEYLKSVGFDYE